jgi:NitT/TauT family transport system substrate-binding protein
MRRVGLCLLIVCAAVCATAFPGLAAQKIAVGKAVSEAWTFLPLDIGQQYGVFARYGLDLNIISFQGDAKLQQGLVSDSISFGLGGGPGMAFAAKGAPAIAVAAYFGAPRNISIIVDENSPIKTPKDLKGKTIAISTTGSLTAWLV